MSMFEETAPAPLDEHDVLRPDADFVLTCPPSAVVPIKHYSCRDTFSDGVYLGVGTFYRAWHIRVKNPMLGKRESCVKVGVRYHMAYPDGFLLFLNGRLRFVFNPTLTNSDAIVVAFKFNDNAFEITGRTAVTSVEFNLLVNGVVVKEVKETPDIALDELRPGLISINEVRVANDGKKPTVYYRLSFSLDGGISRVETERRYSEFVALDEIVRGHLSGHLKSTLPTLPGRIMNPFVNQSSDKFIQERKLALQQYLMGVQGNNKVRIDLIWLELHSLTVHLWYVGIVFSRVLRLSWTRPAHRRAFETSVKSSSSVPLETCKNFDS
jgi:hypothetical protein